MSYERAMGTDTVSVLNTIVEVDQPVIEPERFDESGEIARISALTDQQLAQEVGVLLRESWVATCGHSHFARYREYRIANTEYERRNQQREMPPVPLPLDVSCFAEHQSQREFDQTIDDIFPSVPIISEPIKSYLKAIRYVLVPGAEFNDPLLGGNKLLTAAILAIPPVVGYWTWKKKDGSIPWTVAAVTAGVYGPSLAWWVLFLAAMGSSGGFRI